MVCGVENERENTYTDLLEKFKDNALGLRHFSFRLSGEEGIINSMRKNYQREKNVD